MNIKKGRVGNPLTIIAIFSGITETSAAVILPLISTELQMVFVFFLMGFPILLVLLFFGTLWKKHHVLYAPSDFGTDGGFLEAGGYIRSQTVEERQFKIEFEKQELPTPEPSNNDSITNIADDVTRDLNQFKLEKRNLRMRAIYAEQLVFQKLRLRHGNNLQTNMTYEIARSQRLQFDAFVQKNQVLNFFEIKYYPADKVRIDSLEHVIDNYRQVRANNSSPMSTKLHLILVLENINNSNLSPVEELVQNLVGEKDVSIEIIHSEKLFDEADK